MCNQMEFEVSKGKTIMEVIEDNLCTGCGTCAVMCPFSGIEIVRDDAKGKYSPKLNEKACNQCGICYHVCPGHSVNFNQLSHSIFGKKAENILLGNYLNCYVGHATDYHVRYNSSSGGLITTLLIFALEEGMIDGALVTRMKKGNALEPEPFIASTKAEIIEASKSKYCPVPANIALRQILEKEGKYAVVGLPCHINGIRKAEMINRKLKDRVVLHLGLFCNHTPNFWATKLLLQKLKVREDEIVRFDYRGEGWPGYMKISKQDGDLLLPLPDYWSFVGAPFFYPSRCLLCSDGVCELADISFGDAWLAEMSEDKIGKSILICKHQMGEELLQAMKSKNTVELTEVRGRKVIQSQAGMLYFKKKNLNARSKLFKVVPKCDNLLESDTLDYVLALFPYLNSCLGSKTIFRKILPRVPSKLIRLYGIPYAVISSRKANQSFKELL